MVLGAESLMRWRQSANERVKHSFLYFAKVFARSCGCDTDVLGHVFLCSIPWCAVVANPDGGFEYLLLSSRQQACERGIIGFVRPRFDHLEREPSFRMHVLKQILEFRLASQMGNAE